MKVKAKPFVAVYPKKGRGCTFYRDGGIWTPDQGKLIRSRAGIFLLKEIAPKLSRAGLEKTSALGLLTVRFCVAAEEEFVIQGCPQDFVHQQGRVYIRREHGGWKIGDKSPHQHHDS